MRILFIIAFSIISTVSFSQAKWEDIMKKAKTSSSDYLESYISKDWDEYISLTHDNIVTIAGGKEILIKVAEETMSMYSSIGYNLVAVKIGDDIQSADSEAGLQVIIPAAIQMRGADEATTDTPLKLYGISIDAGKSWKFADLSQYDSQSIETFIPEIDAKIIEYWQGS